MHTQSMSEFDGKFQEDKPCDRKCPKCGYATGVDNMYEGCTRKYRTK
jgi:hypothetical protein